MTIGSIILFVGVVVLIMVRQPTIGILCLLVLII